MNRVKQTFFALAVIVFGSAAIYGLSNYLEKVSPPLPAGFEDSDLSLQGAKLKGYAFGFEGLIADWFWMRSLQYVGDKMLKNRDAKINLDDLSGLNARLLYPYLDNATTLDPRLTVAYEFGANVLPAIDAEKAVRLTEKGIADNPGNWRLYHYLGYIYCKRENYLKAAESYERGSAVEGAPSWMKLMSAQMKSEGGSRETARAIYGQMFEQAQDENPRESALIRLMELDSLDERDAIRAALLNFKEKTNRCPDDLREILPLLRAVKLPGGKDFRLDKSNNLADPSGAPYLLDKQTCDVKLDATKTKLPFETNRKQ